MCGHLFTDKGVVIYSQIKVWSSAHRQNCGQLQQRQKTTTKIVVTKDPHYSNATKSVFYACILVIIGSARCNVSQLVEHHDEGGAPW